MTHFTFTTDQDSFRGRNDDGSESAATWKTASANQNWTQLVDTNFRVRFLIQESGGGSNNNTDLKLRYNLAGAGWNDVTSSSSVVRAVSSAHYTNTDDTLQRIGAGTFIADNNGMIHSTGAHDSTVDFVGNDEAEFEFCVQILSGDVTDGQTLQLRVERSAAALDTYTNTPTITVSEPAATSLPHKNRVNHFTHLRM